MHQTVEKVEKFSIFLSDTKSKQSGFYRQASDTKWKECILTLVKRHKKFFFGFYRLIRDTLKKALVITVANHKNRTPK
jgi:hypothetical protein